jgi:uncharacterized protein YbjQ (UPF0145 family)
MEYKVCPNCEKKLNGLMITKSMVSQETVDFINHFNTNKSEAYCSGCSPILIQNFTSLHQERISKLGDEVKKLLDVIPIITINSPLNWDYKVKGIVSAQSVSGTGFMSELSSSFSDLIGSQSNALGDKLNNGENICRSEIRLKAAMMGGNAIIASDIDYAEVGGTKAMLMVCMAGTAVKLNNLSSVIDVDSESLNKLETIVGEIQDMKKIKLPAQPSYN